MIGSFFFGAAAYPLLEIAWRGRTHASMALAGGLSMLLIRRASKLPGGLARKAMLCGAVITGIEYACGKIWNRDWQIWDYRRVPMNLEGQICLPYTLVWCALSGAMLMVIQPKK